MKFERSVKPRPINHDLDLLGRVVVMRGAFPAPVYDCLGGLAWTDGDGLVGFLFIFGEFVLAHVYFEILTSLHDPQLGHSLELAGACVVVGHYDPCCASSGGCIPTANGDIQGRRIARRRSLGGVNSWFRCRRRSTGTRGRGAR